LLKYYKKVIITIVAILILLTIIIVGVFIFTNDKKDNTKPTKNTKTAITETKIIKDETFKGLEFTNTTFIKDKDLYTLSIDVTNPSDNEINIEKAYTHLTKGRKYRYNTIENFCLSFLNFFLEETPDKLIEFLKTTDSFTEEELDDIRAYFTTCAKAKVSSNCKKTGNPKKNYSMA